MNRFDDVRALISQSRPIPDPGLSCTIITPDGDVADIACGVSDIPAGERIRADHRFAIGSITKTLVAIVVHQLAEEHTIDLSEPVTRYLDGPEVRGIANAATAPIASLLDHTSGIPTWEFDPDWIRRARGSQWEPGMFWTPTQTLAYAVGGDEATSTSAGAYGYSNTNHTLLGLVIEAVTGRRFAEVIRSRISEPLSLDTFALESFEQVPDGAMATPYHLANEHFMATAGVHPTWKFVGPELADVSAVNLSAEWAAGGYVGTMSDLAAFGSAITLGRFGDSVDKAIRNFRPVPGLPDDRLAVSKGLFLMQSADTTVMGHFGGTLGYCAALLMPVDGSGIVLAAASNLGRMHTEPGSGVSEWHRWVINVLYPAANKMALE